MAISVSRASHYSNSSDKQFRHKLPIPTRLPPISNTSHTTPIAAAAESKSSGTSFNQPSAELNHSQGYNPNKYSDKLIDDGQTISGWDDKDVKNEQFILHSRSNSTTYASSVAGVAETNRLSPSEQLQNDIDAFMNTQNEKREADKIKSTLEDVEEESEETDNDYEVENDLNVKEIINTLDR